MVNNNIIKKIILLEVIMVIKVLITVLVTIIVLLILALCKISSISDKKAQDILKKHEANDYYNKK